MKAQIALIMVILLVVAGCNLNPSVTPDAPVVTITVTSEISNTSMTTYVDTRSGVAFDYPMGWTISPPPPEDALIYSYSIASYDLNNPPITPSKSQEGLPPGLTKMDVTFHGTHETVESLRQSLQADVQSGMTKILAEQPRTSADGKPAYYYEIQGRFEGTAYLLQTSVNGHTMSVVVYGEGAHFEDVTRSLRAA